MFNRFKNVLYGTTIDQQADELANPASNNSTESSNQVGRVDFDYREAVFGKRIRSVIKRSTSFQDYLTSSRNNTNTYNSNTIDNSQKAKLLSSGVVAGNGKQTNHEINSSAPDHQSRTLNRSRSIQDLEYNYVRDPYNGDPRRRSKFPKYRYLRPVFLQLKHDDEILVSADHQIRPIILPRESTKLPWKSGYAECINAGKSARNEDQAACYHDFIIPTTPIDEDKIYDKIGEIEKVTGSTTNTNKQEENVGEKLPWYYFGIFDGHAGDAVAIAASLQLHHIISEKLNEISGLLLACDEFLYREARSSSSIVGQDEEFADCEEKIESTEGGRPNSKQPNQNDEAKNVDMYDSQGGELNKEQNNNNLSVVVESSSDNEQELAVLEGEDLTCKTTKTTTTTQTKIVDNEGNTSPTSNDNEKPIVSASMDSNSQERHDNNHHEPTIRENDVELKSPYQVDVLTGACEGPSGLFNFGLSWYNIDSIDLDSLIKGLLESAFLEMDAKIAQDKKDYFMPGGCTAIISLFIFGKLYVCNAGDSKAIVSKNNKPIPMSFDFTPISEKNRILRLGLQRPEFLGNEFTHLEFIRRPNRRDLGKQMLFKDANMTGWSVKRITLNDLKLPLVSGTGKRSRALATIGVTRGFGDHELKAQFGSVPIKPFLTPEPEVRVLDLMDNCDGELRDEDVLIMGSDGLWDVTTDEQAVNIVKESFESLFPNNEESRTKYRYVTAAQDLVIHSRGQSMNWKNMWQMSNERCASLDDIAVFVIPLKQYRDEFLDWRRKRDEAFKRANACLSKTG